MSAAECTPPRSVEQSDEQLVQTILAGDRDAFDVLYDRYLRRIFRFVHNRVRNRADAEETTQEVFIAVYGALGSFRAEAPFAAWVLGIARRTVANRFKKKTHPTIPLDTADDSPGLDLEGPSLQRPASPLEVYEYNERLARLEASAERDLSPIQRQLFQLHHLEHHSISDIAQHLAKSEDAVKSNLYRARKLLLAR